jgi:hypothetical protein
MRNRTIHLAGLGVAIAVLAGCSTTPPVPVPPKSPASHVAPATCIYFREAITSVPVEGAHQVYQNLHVGLAALITARDPADYLPLQAESLARRLEPKLAAEVVKALADGPTISPHKLDHVRDEIAAKVQAVAADNLAQWPDAAPYAVEVVVVSMYWTDSTVGRHDLGREH